MTRQIIIGAIALPVTDATMSVTREPVMEQSMIGKGGEILYGGLYSAAQGSFGGAYRPTVFQGYIDNLLATSPASYSIQVQDDNGVALKSATCYITGCEISMRAGELAKCTFNFVGQALDYNAANSTATASFSAEVPVFYKSSTDCGTCSEFSIKIDRPYAADDYVLGGPFFSESIYQSGDTKITGTVKLSQRTSYKATDPGNMTLTLGMISTNKTITITGAVLAGADISISGRGLIGKTQNWACPSSGVTFSA